MYMYMYVYIYIYIYIHTVQSRISVCRIFVWPGVASFCYTMCCLFALFR